MKHIAAISVICLTLTTGSTPALGVVSPIESVSNKTNTIVLANFGNNAMRDIAMAKLSEAMDAQAKEAAFERQIELAKNTGKIKQAIKKLKKTVNRTSYVFSGNTPSGWDCSGLTMWFYEQLGIILDHSASKQAKYAGVHVDTPVAGDIVAFKHVNSEKYYHVGIYVGNNKVIHAKKPGTRTEIIELTDGWFSQSEISFIRVIESL